MGTPLAAPNSSFGDRHQGGARPEVRFYFDIVCPYAYLASKQLPELTERLGARIDWRPILLSGVLKSLGSLGTATSEAKQALTRRDLARFCDHLGVELRFPAEHPRRTVEAMRLLTWASPMTVPALAQALFQAYWVSGLDIADPEVLLSIAQSIGLSSAEAGLQSPAISQKLRHKTGEAVSAGVFGVPTFIVDGESGSRLFFGQDRLHFVEAALRSHPLQNHVHGQPGPTVGISERHVANQARKATFVFDLSSPYAYLASTQMDQLSRACGVQIEFFPIFLGGLFRSLGTPLVPVMTFSENKRRHLVEDLSRWAHHYSVPFHFPSRFPVNTLTALRLLTLAGDRTGPLAHELFSRYWVGDQDLADPQVLEQGLAAVGLSPNLLDQVGDPEVKATLMANTKQAEEWGCFGVPSFLVPQPHGPPELFFGQDRLLFVEQALRKNAAP